MLLTKIKNIFKKLFGRNGDIIENIYLKSIEKDKKIDLSKDNIDDFIKEY